MISSNSPEFLAKRLTGSWQQAEIADDGFGQVLNLAVDGSATLDTSLIEELNYNFDGTKLIVVDAEEPDEVRQTATVVITGDVMRETDDETHQSADFVRVLAPAPAVQQRNSIVGTWKRDLSHVVMDPQLSEAEKSKRIAIAKAGLYTYSADGRLSVRVPITSLKGTWSILPDGTLHLEIGNKARDAKVILENDQLTLTNADGSRETFDPVHL